MLIILSFLSFLYLLPVYAIYSLQNISVFGSPIDFMLRTSFLTKIDAIFPFIYSGIIFYILLRVSERIFRKTFDNRRIILFALLFGFYSTIMIGLYINYYGVIINHVYGRFFLNNGTPIPFNGFSTTRQFFPYITVSKTEVQSFRTIVYLPYFILDGLIFSLGNLIMFSLFKRLVGRLRKKKA